MFPALHKNKETINNLNIYIYIYCRASSQLPYITTNHRALHTEGELKLYAIRLRKKALCTLEILCISNVQYSPHASIALDFIRMMDGGVKTPMNPARRVLLLQPPTSVFVMRMCIHLQIVLIPLNGATPPIGTASRFDEGGGEPGISHTLTRQKEKELAEIESAWSIKWNERDVYLAWTRSRQKGAVVGEWCALRILWWCLLSFIRFLFLFLFLILTLFFFLLSITHSLRVLDLKPQRCCGSPIANTVAFTLIKKKKKERERKNEYISKAKKKKKKRACLPAALFKDNCLQKGKGEQQRRQQQKSGEIVCSCGSEGVFLPPLFTMPSPSTSIPHRSSAASSICHPVLNERLQACQEAYQKELATRTCSGAMEHLTAEHKAANKRVFDALLRYQLELEAFQQGKGPAGTRVPPMPECSAVYPENLQLKHYLHLRQILPIPDVHQLSDCDTIYRYLIARHFKVGTGAEFNTVLSDILHYIFFREMYDLNNILHDPMLVATFNGRDGAELLQEAISGLERYDAKHAIQKPVDGAAALTAKAQVDYIKMVQHVRSELSHPMVYDAFRTWSIGLDLTGHVILYQKPKAEQLRSILKRWPYECGAFNCQAPKPHISNAVCSVAPPSTATAVGSPCTTARRPLHDEKNLCVRLHLRSVEKGRRISRMLHHQQQHLLKSCGSWLAPQWAADAVKGYRSDAGGTTCLVDVADISLGTFTAAKFDAVLKVFKIISLLGQSYYPENMHRMLIVNGGFVFRMLFKIVKPWLDPQTQKKIIVLSHTNKYTVDEFLDSSEEVHLSTPLAASPSSSMPLALPASPTSVTSAASSLSWTVNNFQHSPSVVELESTPPRVRKDSKHFELFKSLHEYIPSIFIPAWYGGGLALRGCPLHYAHLLHPDADLLPYIEDLQAAAATESPHVPELPLTFAAHNTLFLQDRREENYWRQMDTLQAHPRFREAADVVETVAPPEILPDTLLLSMLYYNGATRQRALAAAVRSPTQHRDPTAWPGSKESPATTAAAPVWAYSHVPSTNPALAVGPVTDTECAVFGKFLEATYRIAAQQASPLERAEQKMLLSSPDISLAFRRVHHQKKKENEERRIDIMYTYLINKQGKTNIPIHFCCFVLLLYIYIYIFISFLGHDTVRRGLMSILFDLFSSYPVLLVPSHLSVCERDYLLYGGSSKGVAQLQQTYMYVKSVRVSATYSTDRLADLFFGSRISFWLHINTRRSSQKITNNAALRVYRCVQRYVCADACSATCVPMRAALRVYRCVQRYVCTDACSATCVPMRAALRVYRCVQRYVCTDACSATCVPMRAALRVYRCVPMRIFSLYLFLSNLPPPLRTAMAATEPPSQKKKNACPPPSEPLEYPFLFARVSAAEDTEPTAAVADDDIPPGSLPSSSSSPPPAAAVGEDGKLPVFQTVTIFTALFWLLPVFVLAGWLDRKNREVAEAIASIRQWSSKPEKNAASAGSLPLPELDVRVTRLLLPLFDRFFEEKMKLVPPNAQTHRFTQIFHFPSPKGGRTISRAKVEGDVHPPRPAFIQTSAAAAAASVNALGIFCLWPKHNHFLLNYEHREKLAAMTYIELDRLRFAFVAVKELLEEHRVYNLNDGSLTGLAKRDIKKNCAADPHAVNSPESGKDSAAVAAASKSAGPAVGRGGGNARLHHGTSGNVAVAPRPEVVQQRKEVQEKRFLKEELEKMCQTRWPHSPLAKSCVFLILEQKPQCELTGEEPLGIPAGAANLVNRKGGKRKGPTYYLAAVDLPLLNKKGGVARFRGSKWWSVKVDAESDAAEVAIRALQNFKG
eukprot:gene504-274_t